MAETKAERRAAWKKRTTKTATALRKAKATVTTGGKRSIPTTARTPAEIRVAAYRAEHPERVVVDPVTGKHTRIDTRTGAATVISRAPGEAMDISIKDVRTVGAREAAERERAAAIAALVTERPRPTHTDFTGMYGRDISYDSTSPPPDIAAHGRVVIEKKKQPLKTAEQVLFEQKYLAVSQLDISPQYPHKLKTEYETPYDISGDRLTAIEDPITELMPSIEEISRAGAELHEKYPTVTGPIVTGAEALLETARKYDEPHVEKKEALLDIQRQLLIGTAPDPSLRKPTDTVIPGPIEKSMMFAGGTAIGAYEGIREHPVKAGAMFVAGVLLPGVTKAVTGVAGAVPVIGGTLARYGVPVAMTGVTVHYGMDVIKRVDAPVPSGKMKRVRITQEEYINSYFKQYGTMPVLDPKQKYDFYIDVPTERVPTEFERGKVFGEILGTEIIPMGVGVGLTKIKLPTETFREFTPTEPLPKTIDRRIVKDTRSKKDIAFDEEVLRLQKQADKAADTRTKADIAFDKELELWHKRAGIEKELKSDIAFDQRVLQLQRGGEKLPDTRTKADIAFDKELELWHKRAGMEKELKSEIAFDKELQMLKDAQFFKRVTEGGKIKDTRTKADIAFDKEVLRIQKEVSRLQRRATIGKRKPDPDVIEHIQEIPQPDGTVLLTKTIEKVKVKPTQALLEEPKLKKKIKTKTDTTTVAVADFVVGDIEYRPSTKYSQIVGIGMGLGISTRDKIKPPRVVVTHALKHTVTDREKVMDLERIKIGDITGVPTTHRIAEITRPAMKEDVRQDVRELTRLVAVPKLVYKPKEQKKVVGRVRKETPFYAWNLANPIATLEQMLGVASPKRKITKKRRSKK